MRFIEISPYSLHPCLLVWPDILLPAHVGAQCLRDAHRAVRLLVRLDERDQDARRGDGGVVERVDKLHLAVSVAIADVGAPRLPLVEVRTRMRLAVAALARYPAFEIVHADFAVAHVARADIDDAIRQFQRLHQLLRVSDQLLMPVDRLFMAGPADYILLYLVELLHGHNAACILAIGAGLLAEAGAEADEGHGQVFDIENLVLEHAGDRHLCRADQEKLLVLDLIDLLAALWKLAVAD